MKKMYLAACAALAIQVLSVSPVSAGEDINIGDSGSDQAVAQDTYPKLRQSTKKDGSSAGGCYCECEEIVLCEGRLGNQNKTIHYYTAPKNPCTINNQPNCNVECPGLKVPAKTPVLRCENVDGVVEEWNKEKVKDAGGYVKE